MRLKKLTPHLPLCFLFLLLFQAADAQGWIRPYNYPDFDQVRVVRSLPNGDFLLAGDIDFSTSTGDVWWAMRTDQFGVPIWRESYHRVGTDTFMILNDAELDSDTTALLVGSLDPASLSRAAISRIDLRTGQLLTTRFYEFSNNAGWTIGLELTVLKNGYLFSGWDYNWISGEKTWVCMLNTNLDTVWSKRPPASFRQGTLPTPVGMDTTFGDTFLLAVTEWSYFPSRQSGSLVVYKMDLNGNTLQTSNHGDVTGANAHNITPFPRHFERTADGGFVMLNRTLRGTGGNLKYAPLLVRCNRHGDTLWTRATAFTDSVSGFALDVAPDGSIYVTGGVGRQLEIEQYNSSGTLLWRKQHANFSFFAGYDLEVLPGNKGLVITGAYDNLVGNTEVFLMGTDSLGNATSNYISGNVWYDANSNCNTDAGELDLSGWVVEADDGVFQYYALTDQNGAYDFSVGLGSYTLTVFPPSLYWVTNTNCSSQPVQFTMPYDSAEVKLPQLPLASCPAMYVDVSAPFLRRCRGGNVHTVKYCNYGAQAANPATIDVTFDSTFVVDSATVAWTGVSGNTYTFNVGQVGINQCGEFKVYTSINCSTTVNGQSHCVEAHIFPDTLCVPGDSSWDKSSIRVAIECINGDSARFRISNVGTGNMMNRLPFIVTEDNILRIQGTFQLTAGNDTVFSELSSGGTWHLRADQSPNHPYGAVPVGFSLEGCGRNGMNVFSTGFFNAYPVNNIYPWVSIDCQPNIGSFDPNDKVVTPTGTGAQHLTPPNTLFKYRIRFQNTGTDTAFRVVLLDTVRAELDLATLQLGGASHPYTFRIEQGNILVWTFDNILLPDSNTNEPLSHGYVSFTMRNKVGIQNGEVVENDAAIYFDFNAPVITNLAFNTIGTDILLSVDPPVGNERKPGIRLYPNPVRDRATLELLGEGPYQGAQLELYDLQGRQVLREGLNYEGKASFSVLGLQEGIYIFRIVQDGAMLGSGKILVR